jgi:hypothetical protein
VNIIIIDQACVSMEDEAVIIAEILSGVDNCLLTGATLITRTQWTVPSNTKLKAAIYAVCMKRKLAKEGNKPGVCPHAVRRALNLLSPKDKRTLIELCKKGLERSHPAELLTERAAG